MPRTSAVRPRKPVRRPVAGVLPRHHEATWRFQCPRSALPTRLPTNALVCPLGQVLRHLAGHGDFPRPSWMLELPVASFLRDLGPAILGQEPDQVAHFHADSPRPDGLHRSTSPSTISRLPRIPTTSATV